MRRRPNETLSSWRGGRRAAVALGSIALVLWLVFPRSEVPPEAEAAPDEAPEGFYEIGERSWTVEPVAQEAATEWEPSYDERLREKLGAEARERWNNLDIALKNVGVIDVR